MRPPVDVKPLSELSLTHSEDVSALQLAEHLLNTDLLVFIIEPSCVEVHDFNDFFSLLFDCRHLSLLGDDILFNSFASINTPILTLLHHVCGCGMVIRHNYEFCLRDPFRQCIIPADLLGKLFQVFL